MSSLYLYAIVDKPPRPPLGRTLRVVRVGGAHVVAEQGSAREVNAANLKKHDRVVKRITRSCAAVLPFRFGSVVDDKRSLAALLAPITPAIQDALDLVRDAVQFTLRVYGTAAKAPAPAAKAKRPEGPGTRFLTERLRAHRVPEIDVVSVATKPLVRATHAQRHDRPPLLASVYHLVAREDARRYRAKLDAARKELRDVRVDVTGPWPAYAFSEIP